MKYTEKDIENIPLTKFLDALDYRGSVYSDEDVKWYCAPYRWERSPKLRVDERTNRWNDEVTGESGDIRDLARLLMHKLTTRNIARFLQKPRIYRDTDDFIVRNMNDFEVRKLDPGYFDLETATFDVYDQPIPEFLNFLHIEYPYARDGKLHLYNAPYNEDHAPTLLVNVKTNTWCDIRTGAYGDIYDLAHEITSSCNIRELNRFIMGDTPVIQDTWKKETMIPKKIAFPKTDPTEFTPPKYKRKFRM